ncbi:MAG: hypothetical protein ACD_79C00677G0002 [uncultured bacterium]|nr:MAG: hypothetical protein ACD_79C00677G0002 [uncultured bacterium]
MSHDFENASIEHAKVSHKSIIFFSLIIIIILIVSLYFNVKYQIPILEEALDKKEQNIQLTEWDTIVLQMQKAGYITWKTPKVGNFFEDLTPLVLNESLKKGCPPGAIIAIAAHESGYGTGYIGCVTGNILSLSARKNEIMLPSLNLPITKNKDIVIDNEQIRNMLASGHPIKLVQRPPSFKKDYRPSDIAGTDAQLDYFLHHPDLRFKAWESNIKDLLYDRILSDSTIPAYKETAELCKRIYDSKSLKRLLSGETSKRFISLIGGKPNSYNSREEWRDKILNMIDNLGLEYFLILYIKHYEKYYPIEHWNSDIY